LEQITSGGELVTFKTLANWLDGKVSTKDLLSGLPDTNIASRIDKKKVQLLFDTIVKLIERMFTRKGTLRPDPEHLAPFKDVLYVIGLRGSSGRGEYFFLDDIFQFRLGPYNPDTPPTELLPPLFRKDQKIDTSSNPFLSRDKRIEFYEQLVSFAKKTHEIDLVLHEDLMGEDYIPPYAKKTKALGSIPSCPHCGKVLTLHDKNYGAMSLGTYADFLCGPPPHYDCHPCKKHFTIETLEEFP
jgi:hypothetical protein